MSGIRKYPSNVVIESDPLAIKIADLIQTVQNDSTKIASSAAIFEELALKATPAQITAAIDNLVDSAPGALDTLYELSTALGNDSNFATTITNALALRELLSNKSTNTSLGTSDTLYPSQKAVKAYADAIATAKQETLVSGTNIKSINGSSLLGPGNLEIGSAINFTYGETITAGNLVELRSDGKVYKINALSVSGYQTGAFDSTNSGVFCDNANQKIIVWGKNSTGNYKIRVGSLSGTTITWGTAVDIYASTTTPSKFSICYNASQSCYVIAFSDSANTGLDLRAFTVSGNTITLGTTLNITGSGAAAVILHTESLSNSNIAICYRFGGNTFLRTISISGTTLTANSAIDLGFPSSMDSLVWNSNESKLYVALGSYIHNYSLSGSTLTLSQGNISSRQVYTTSSFRNMFYNSFTGKTVLVLANGNRNTFFNIIPHNYSTSNDSLVLERICDSDNIAINSQNTVYKYSTNNNSIINICTQTNTPLNFHLEAVNQNMLRNVFLNVWTSATAIFQVDTNLGAGLVGNGAIDKIVVIKNLNLANYIGIANASGVLNESKEVKIGGSVYTTSGLTAGANYYVQLDGTYSTTPTGLYLGKAISTTQLLLDI
jgi:hypothetical protein